MKMYCVWKVKLKTWTKTCKNASFIITAAREASLCSLLYKSLVRGVWPSESWASSKNELQGSLDVTICGLQRPQHQLLILDPHVPELLHLGLPAALAKQKRIHWIPPSHNGRPSAVTRAGRTVRFQPCVPFKRRVNDFTAAVQHLSMLPQKKERKRNTGSLRCPCELTMLDVICSLTCRADMLEACRACCRAWLKRSLLTGVPAGIGATLLEESPWIKDRVEEKEVKKKKQYLYTNPGKFCSRHKLL